MFRYTSLFSTNYIKSLNFQKVDKPVDSLLVEQLHTHKKSAMQKMKTLHPNVMEINLSGKIAYRLSGRSPKEIIEVGGFPPRSNGIWLTNVGDNQGSVCFSFLPEVTSLFIDNIPRDKTPYIYAFPLVGEFFATGGPWRQVISPGAFPITKWWIARELVDIKNNNQLILGPLVGQTGSNTPIIVGERFEQYCSNQLFKPDEYSLPQSEDYPSTFHIKDTPWTAAFQREVEEHYAEKKVNCRRPSL